MDKPTVLTFNIPANVERVQLDIAQPVVKAEESSARAHAPDCQSHIVDVRGRPDECTCDVSKTEGQS